MWAPSPENTNGGKDGPIEGWSRTPESHQTLLGARWGGLGVAIESGPESVYNYVAVQYSWSIPPLRDQEHGPTRIVGRPMGSYMLLFLPKVEVGLKSRNNWLSGPTGVVPTLGGLQ